MGKQEGYPFLYVEDETYFYFESIGSEGSIIKIIAFQKTPRPMTYNLAFGDLTEEGIDDVVMSGNKDVRKIYKTVINAIHIFLENNSGAIIVFKGSDRKRHHLYHKILVKFYDEISSEFELLGDTFNDEVVPFNKLGIYSQYQIKKK